MINISKLYAGAGTTGDPLRYGSDGPTNVLHDHHFNGHARSVRACDRKPIVVWNVTKRCNLACIHCYTNSDTGLAPDELTAGQAEKLIEDLANYKIPALLFSGGEPLTKPEIFDYASLAVSHGLRPVLSTNGTLIDRAVAEKLKKIGFIYVGISLDGIGETNDVFRGKKGAFRDAMRGFDNCLEVGQRVGLRLTLTKKNFLDLDAIFDFIIDRKIPRACFYHLVYSGRGKSMEESDLSHAETRQALDVICRRTKEAISSGVDLDILTVDNHVDGPYILMKLIKEKSDRIGEVRNLLEWNGGGTNSTGVGIGNIDWAGNVHPDQFWQDITFGNVIDRPFSEIWQDTSNELMAGLKNKLPLLKGLCENCRFKSMCGGSLRVRAYRIFGDPWMHDPACYLSDEERLDGDKIES